MQLMDNMTLDEVDATLAQLRERRRALKQVSKVSQRKIQTLARRREKLLEKVRVIDEQIDALRSGAAAASPDAPRRRGRRPKAMQMSA